MTAKADLTIGGILTRIREQLDKTQEEFRQYLGVKANQTTISEWELNRFCPNRLNMERIIKRTKRFLTSEELKVLETVTKPTPTKSEK